MDDHSKLLCAAIQVIVYEQFKKKKNPEKGNWDRDTGILLSFFCNHLYSMKNDSQWIKARECMQGCCDCVYLTSQPSAYFFQKQKISKLKKNRAGSVQEKLK